MFNTKTLISITAPTAAGKSYLLLELEKRGFSKLISTTTRSPRSNEVDGSDYFFISEEKSLQIEERGEFAELITFNNIRYGITKEEVEKKLSTSTTNNHVLPVIVILTPEGVDIYQDFCDNNNITMVKVFIKAPQVLRIKRLEERIIKNMMNEFYIPRKDINKSLISCIFTNHLHVFSSRLQAILTEEQSWESDKDYDIIVPGDNTDTAIGKIENFLNIGRELKNVQL